MESALDAALGRALFESALDPMMLTGPADGTILDANPAACRALGYSVEQIRALGREGLRDPADDRWEAGLQERARTGRFAGELSFRRADGTTFPAEASSSVFTVGQQLYAVLILRDVSERRALEQQLREAAAEMARLAIYDELTGLLNRRGFLTAGRPLVEQARRSRRPVLVLAADVDGLKPVNDEHGHAAGDQVLRDIAAVLGDALRDADVVARIGGDEFAVILSGAPSIRRALSTVERLERDLRNYAHARERPYSLSVSVGMARRDHGGEPADLEALLNEADAELYRTKRGRLRVPKTRPRRQR